MDPSEFRLSTLHALAAAREAALPGVRQHGLAGRPEIGRLRVYCSEQAHSSVDKAVILLGLGHEALVRIPTDEQFRMRADALRAAIERDRAGGSTPLAVVATVGTTSTTSVDRSTTSPTSARSNRCGCTSTPPTLASRPCSRLTVRTSPAGTAPIRSWSTRTSSCSCRSI
jgi:hypothetical protein